MTNAHRFLQNLAVFGSVVPLAIFLGYLAVAPPDLATYGTYALVFLLLLLPMLLQYHHIALIVAWNLSLVIPLRGSPQLWVLVAFLSFAVIMFRRTLGRGFRMLNVPALTAPLIVLAVIILVTALLRGGLGLGAFGSGTGGGKRYFFALSAIVGYFALSSLRIQEHRAKTMVTLFFITSVTYAIGALVPYVPESFYFIFSFFPPETAGLEFSGGEIVRADVDISRSFVLTLAFAGVLKAMLSYFGLRRLLDVKRPWLPVAFGLVLILSLTGGFRTALLSIALMCGLLFILEGLYKTRILWIWLFLGIATFAAILPFSQRLPTSVQRTLSVLPFVNVDPVVKIDADYSTEWRVQMWRIVLPTVPQYLLVGKGYAIDIGQLQVLSTLVQQGQANSMEVSMLSGDYHSGPLSLIIPLGLPGVIAVLWFWAAGILVLWRNYKWSPPNLKNLNRFLFVLFLSSIIFFCFVFGAFYLELAAFTGIAALSVSVNGGMRRGAPVSPQVPGHERRSVPADMTPAAAT